ncbi:MAG: histidine phosphatase family protein [Phycisphaerae bacterium]
MLVYAVRHALSLANVDAGAGLDSSLTDLGRDQTDALVARFAGVRLAAVYASPLARCLQTALPIAEALDLPVRLRPELFEYHGLSPGARADLVVDEAETLAKRNARLVSDPDLPGPPSWPAVDEAPEALARRMSTLAAALKTRWTAPDDVVLLISHGSPIARLIDAWLSDDRGRSFRYLIDNAAVTALRRHDGVSSLVCLNETSHLRGLAAPPSANYDSRGHIKPIAPGNYW